MTKRVTCIKKRDRTDLHEKIQGIGGDSWYTPEDQAISNIEGRSETYYVSVGGKSVDVVVATRNGRKYLKTTADGYSPDNLLALPNC